MASRLAIATLVQLVLHYGKWNLRINERTAWEIVQRAEHFYRKRRRDRVRRVTPASLSRGDEHDADGRL